MFVNILRNTKGFIYRFYHIFAFTGQNVVHLESIIIVKKNIHTYIHTYIRKRQGKTYVP